jgi:hypothetical protein
MKNRSITIIILLGLGSLGLLCNQYLFIQTTELATEPATGELATDVAVVSSADEPSRVVVTDLEKANPLELYQNYYALQKQRDTLTARWHGRRIAAYQEEGDVKIELDSNTSDLELHRRLIRAQNEQKQSERDWLDAIGPLDTQMDAIREELKSRGEPPPA